MNVKILLSVPYKTRRVYCPGNDTFQHVVALAPEEDAERVPGAHGAGARQAGPDDRVARPVRPLKGLEKLHLLVHPDHLGLLGPDSMNKTPSPSL